MRTLMIFLLTSLSTISAAQKVPVQPHTQGQIMSTRQLHQWAISSTVAVVAGPNHSDRILRFRCVGQQGWICCNLLACRRKCERGPGKGCLSRRLRFREK